VRRILGRWLYGLSLELGDVGCHYLCLPFSLKLSQNVLADTILVKVTFNGGNNLIYD
jgi:hypothetical protein